VKVLLTVGVFIVCYLIGSIPMGLVLTRITTGRDIRQVGSGRTGATNVLRGAGPWIALLTILGDALKGFLAVLVARVALKTNAAEAIAGLLAVIGHNYSVFIKFRGGAGTVATVGGAMSIWPWSAAILVLVGTGVIAATRYASLGSIAIALVVPILMALRVWQAGEPWIYLLFGLGTSILTLWALRPNIRRLLEGCERRVRIKFSENY
jgi:acyl phosphate:glycerol-3-phosphate acyltransferase